MQVVGYVGVFLVLALLMLLGIVVGTYNKLVRLRNLVDNAWSQIDIQLKRRFDLIPNLVATVKGYAAHEAGTLEAVTAARSAAMGASSPAASAKADGMLAGALKSLFAVAEAYPDLKANASFLDLQSKLSDTEDKVAYSRQAYNDAAMTYNTTTQTVPSNIVAGLLGFKARELFEAPEGEDVATAPKVGF